MGKLKEKIDRSNVVQFIQESVDDLRQSLDTGDYKFSVERTGEDLLVKSSRDLSVGDYTEIMVNILMMTPHMLREDLIALVIYVSETLQQEQDSRILN